jgi:uncharacterized membrane protein (UPF0182 family)
MNKSEFMLIMHIPQEWEKFGMYPNELFKVQIERFEPSHVEGSEHDRNGMFHWWLRQEPSKAQLLKLVALTFLDPDPLMAEDVRSHICISKNFDIEVSNAIKSAA